MVIGEAACQEPTTRHGVFTRSTERMQMAPRSFWNGYLKLSLVTCPVAMMPATSENEKVRFHTLNSKTGNRVVSQYVDAVSGKTVDEDDEVKGYPRGEDDYVLLEDDELEAVALESTRTIDINMFVSADSIDWIWYDKPHYLMPDDPVGEEAFSVIRDAMESTGTVGVSRLVLYRRERAVMLEPRDKGIVLWTLRYGDEVRDPKEYFGESSDEKIDAGLMKLIIKLIEDRIAPWDPKMVGDPVQAKLLDIITAKKKGRKRPVKTKTKTEAAAPPSNVISIMDALKKSIASDSKPRRR
jgi:DNA end-binding protein Ku